MEIHQAASGRQWRISGAMEIAEAEVLQEALCGMTGRHISVELDLSEVSLCDPASAQLLCSAVKTAARLGGRLKITALSPPVKVCCQELGFDLAGNDTRNEFPAPGNTWHEGAPEPQAAAHAERLVGGNDGA
ncbi:MAG: STAS domain-containing protein [Paludibaculum sp.]